MSSGDAPQDSVTLVVTSSLSRLAFELQDRLSDLEVALARNLREFGVQERSFQANIFGQRVEDWSLHFLLLNGSVNARVTLEGIELTMHGMQLASLQNVGAFLHAAEVSIGDAGIDCEVAGRHLALHLHRTPTRRERERLEELCSIETPPGLGEPLTPGTVQRFQGEGFEESQLVVTASEYVESGIYVSLYCRYAADESAEAQAARFSDYVAQALGFIGIENG